MRRLPGASCGARQLALLALALEAGACQRTPRAASAHPTPTGPAEHHEGVLPDGRGTAWNPGIAGGIPERTKVCATVQASAFGNGSQDASAGIQAAIDACPEGQVVKLSRGEFLVNAAPVHVHRGVVLRGEGAAATRLVKTDDEATPVVVIGARFRDEAASVDLTADAPKGATTVQVSSGAGFAKGQLVLVDERTDPERVYWGRDVDARRGGPARGWFCRYDRPIGQVLEVTGVAARAVTFTPALHIGIATAHGGQLTRFDVPYGARQAGLEDLYVRGGRDDNITLRFALDSWIRNVDSDASRGDSVAVDACLRCVVRDSYFHDAAVAEPGGDGYLLSVGEATTDSLVENNVFVKANKVMVMRASGGGNVIAYNYFDDGYIAHQPDWMETGLNSAHMACPHFELFEGNQAFNIDADDTWGGGLYNTFFRNHATGKRRSFPDAGNRRAIGVMTGHYFYSFVGNVLGTAGQDPAPYRSFEVEDSWPWNPTSNPVSMWRIGYAPEMWIAPPDRRVVETLHRHGNFDFVSNAVQWAPGYDLKLPDSLYLKGKPAFFGDRPWPWVTPEAAPRVHVLPARERFDAGAPVR
jgi:hypothetical protein